MPDFPNQSSVNISMNDPGCPTGCLFKLDTDPEERQDLKSMAQMVSDQLRSRLQAKILEAMNEKLIMRTAELNATNHELNSLIDTANAPIFAVDAQRQDRGLVQTAPQPGCIHAYLDVAASVHVRHCTA